MVSGRVKMTVVLIAVAVIFGAVVAIDWMDASGLLAPVS